GAASGPVSAGRGAAQTLTEADAVAIKTEITLAKNVAPELTRRYQITASGTNTNTTVNGTVPSYPEVRNAQMDIGSFISDENISSMSKVAVLGPATRDDLFGSGADPTGQSIRINKINFRVIGVTKSKGGSGFSNQDDIVFVPITTAQTYLSGNASSYVSEIDIEAANASDMAVISTTSYIFTFEKAQHFRCNARRFSSSKPARHCKYSFFCNKHIYNFASINCRNFFGGRRNWNYEHDANNGHRENKRNWTS
ncbi:MAG: ABC transporter permease, partial [Candidatus Staskawiczbacteria bacterium]|nr:ABC transporter permease [Candidatus Staskawiczbacteria bacterium]